MGSESFLKSKRDKPKIGILTFEEAGGWLYLNVYKVFVTNETFIKINLLHVDIWNFDLRLFLSKCAVY